MGHDATDDAADRISAAERLTAALANASDDPFAAVVAATQTPVVITDPRQVDNPIIFVNDSFCRMTGYARDESVGRNCRFLQGPDSDPAAVAAIRAAVAAHRPIEIDLRNYRRDGTPFWNRLAIAPVFNAAREVTFFFASQIDVTAEHERLTSLESDKATLTAELAGRLDALRASEARLRVATEAGQIGVWEIVLPERTLTATPTLNAIYGLPPGPTPSYEAVRALAHPDDAARVLTAFDRAAAGDGDYHVVYRVVRADGMTGWVEVRGQVDRTSDGTPRRILGVTQDVTARRTAELQLELSEESLRLATAAGSVGTWDLDLATDVLTWPPATKAMFGISPHAPCSMTDF